MANSGLKDYSEVFQLMSELSLISRPPLGFVVEGAGEHGCYPSIVSRIVNASNFDIPIVNAGGYGGIIRNIQEQLTSLVRLKKPYHIIVTVDLKDVIDAGFYSTCADLLLDLNGKIDDWFRSAQDDTRLQSLPERISVVIQVLKFESWFAADVAGLKTAGYVQSDVDQPDNTDKLRNPDQWLKDRIIGTKSVKNQRHARLMVSSINPETMRDYSPSFDKFYREVQSSFTSWCSDCQLTTEF